jgi:purine nucleosidase
LLRGPVTNLALALVKAIDCKAIPQDNHHGVDDLSSWHSRAGNDKTFANDLEATQIVFRSGADITLVGMDVTMTTLFSSGKMDEVAREGDQAARR